MVSSSMMLNMPVNLNTTSEERSQCLADMADTEHGHLKNYDVSFGFIRRLIVDAETAEMLMEERELERKCKVPK